MNTAHLIYWKDEEGSVDENSFSVFVASTEQEVKVAVTGRKRSWLIENDIHPEDAGLPFEFNEKTDGCLSEAVVRFWNCASDDVVVEAFDSLMEYNEGWYVTDVPIMDAVEG